MSRDFSNEACRNFSSETVFFQTENDDLIKLKLFTAVHWFLLNFWWIVTKRTHWKSISTCFNVTRNNKMWSFFFFFCSEPKHFRENLSSTNIFRRQGISLCHEASLCSITCWRPTVSTLSPVLVKEDKKHSDAWSRLQLLFYPVQASNAYMHLATLFPNTPLSIRKI